MNSHHWKLSLNHLIDSKIAGIPCKLEVLTYFCKAPDHTTWDSDMDYYGYTEIEYAVLDRKGYPAKWLERKITPQIDADLRGEISEYMKGLKDD